MNSNNTASNAVRTVINTGSHKIKAAISGMDKIRLTNVRKGLKGIEHRIKVQDYVLGELAKNTDSHLIRNGFEDYRPKQG